MNLTTKTDGELIAMIEAMQAVMTETEGQRNALPFHMAAGLIEQAEQELAEREQQRIQAEIYRALDARAAMDAALRAEQPNWPDVRGTECPF